MNIGTALARALFAFIDIKITFDFTRGWKVFFLPVLLLANLNAVESLSLPDLLVKLGEHTSQVRNLSVTAKWTQREKSRVSESVETINFDNLGRIRFDSIQISDGGKRQTQSDIYDGENTFSITEDPLRDRDGAAVNASKLPNSVYLRAIINPGKHSTAPTTIRNPFTAVGLSVQHDLSSRVSNGTIPTITLVDVDSGTYRVQYSGEEFGGITYTVIIEGKKDWFVSRSEARSAKTDLLLSLQENDLALSDAGFWYPKSGRLQSYSGSEIRLDWAFETKTIAVNSDAFDQRVFHIELKPDTFVSDNRYGVAYRIGKDGAIGDNLAILARVALAEAEAERERFNSAKGSSTVPLARAPAKSWSILLLVNIAVLACVFVCALIVFSVRWFKR